MCPVGCKNKRTKAESAMAKLTTESAYDIKEMRERERKREIHAQARGQTEEKKKNLAYTDGK